MRTESPPLGIVLLMPCVLFTGSIGVIGALTMGATARGLDPIGFMFTPLGGCVAAFMIITNAVLIAYAIEGAWTRNLGRRMTPAPQVERESSRDELNTGTTGEVG